MQRLMWTFVTIMVSVCSHVTAAEPQAKWVLVRAIYGDYETNQLKNVTELVAAKIESGRLQIQAGNDLFGDPAVGNSKMFKVYYRCEGRTEVATVREGETLLIPPARIAGKLVVTRAEYGDLADQIVLDVTSQVAARIRDNSLIMTAPSELFSDPAPGILKQLRVEYQVGDWKLAKTVYESQEFTLTVPLE